MFGPLTAGTRRDVTSALTVAELFVRPHTEADDRGASELLGALLALEGLEVVDVGVAVALEAARVRAGSGVALPDAIQLATAAIAGADALLTNDLRLRVDGAPVDVLILDELVGA